MSVARVERVFQKVFDDKELSIFKEMMAKDVNGWDSFNHLNLILALEIEFDISFSTEEISGIANVGDLIIILQQKGFDLSW
ncbi:MAG: acyl carrier protein [Nitrospirae bacterium]|nr:acyl carrier protein [Nitrospirota bacterium]